MSAKNLLKLLSLAAIWGGSFIFLRVLSPVLGPIITTDLRVLIGGGTLLIYLALIKHPLELKNFWKHYLAIGLLNAALPFFLYAFAALNLPASLEVILNASSPLFTAVFASLWLADPLTPKRSIGLIIGLIGVILAASISRTETTSELIIATLACLTAAASYGLAGIYIKKFASHVKPKAIAACSQMCAGLLLLPLALTSPLPNPEMVTPSVVLNILGLGLLCSALAFLIYYQLIAEVGPTKTITVTFLMPLFGMLWGVLLLNERITLSMIVGCVLILLGTSLVLNLLKFKTKA